MKSQLFTPFSIEADRVVVHSLDLPNGFGMCEACEGSGVWHFVSGPFPDSAEPCPDCDGTGRQPVAFGCDLFGMGEREVWIFSDYHGESIRYAGSPFGNEPIPFTPGFVTPDDLIALAFGWMDAGRRLKTERLAGSEGLREYSENRGIDPVARAKAERGIDWIIPTEHPELVLREWPLVSDGTDSGEYDEKYLPNVTICPVVRTLPKEGVVGPSVFRNADVGVWFNPQDDSCDLGELGFWAKCDRPKLLVLDHRNAKQEVIASTRRQAKEAGVRTVELKETSDQMKPKKGLPDPLQLDS